MVTTSCEWHDSQRHRGAGNLRGRVVGQEKAFDLRLYTRTLVHSALIGNRYIGMVCGVWCTQKLAVAVKGSCACMRFMILQTAINASIPFRIHDTLYTIHAYKLCKYARVTNVTAQLPAVAPLPVALAVTILLTIMDICARSLGLTGSPPPLTDACEDSISAWSCLPRTCTRCIDAVD